MLGIAPIPTLNRNSLNLTLESYSLERHFETVVSLPSATSSLDSYGGYGDLESPLGHKWDEKGNKKSSGVPSLGLNELDKLQETEEEKIERESKLMKGKELYVAFIGFVLVGFLIALDATILSPALPTIISQFGGLDKISWISSAYLLGQTPVLFLASQALTVYNRKYIFQMSVAMFEIGSIVSAAASSMDVLIVGRALSGIGAGVALISSITIITDITTLEQRPRLLGLYGGFLAVASVLGPILGGLFTERLTWRWCFIINVPIGVLSILAVQFSLKSMAPPPMKANVIKHAEKKIKRWTRGYLRPEQSSILFRLAVFDWIGGFFISCAVVSLLLGVTWGGTTYPWQSGQVISTLLLSIFFGILFLYNEYKWASISPLMPLRIWKNPSQIGANIGAFCLSFSVISITFYLPIFFQAALGQTPLESGISLLPLVLMSLFSAVVSGLLISHFGYYAYFCYLGPLIMMVGGGLLFTISETISSAQIIGYQILFAIGYGSVIQAHSIAVQSTVAIVDIPPGTGLLTFCQTLGAAIGISVSSSIFTSLLDNGLKTYAPLAPLDIVRSSVTIIQKLPPALQPGVKHAYVHAIQYSFLIVVPVSACAFLSAFLIKNLNVKGR